MATFKVLVLEHHKKEDGKYNIKVRVTHKRKIVYNHTTYFVTDKQLHKDLEFKDRKIIDIKYNLEKAYYDQANIMGEDVNNYTARELADYLERKVSGNSDDSIDFIAFGRKYTEELIKNGQGSYAAKFTRTLNHLVDFFGTAKVKVTEITAKNLFSFEAYLKNPHDYQRKDQFGNLVNYHHDGLKNGVIDVMGGIRKLFNEAKKSHNDYDKDDIRIKHEPFIKYNVGKVREESAKRNISPGDIIKIRDCEGIRPGSRMELGRDIFMLSFYLSAINTKDLFDATVINNGRLEYYRSKTKSRRKDNAFISIKIEPEAEALLEKYRDPSNKRVFKFYSMYSTDKVFNSMLNVGLKQVAEKVGLGDMVTSYFARHSWGTIAANQCRIQDGDIAFALNHIDSRYRTTNIYIEKSWKIIDEANRKVLDQLKYKNEEEKISADFDDLLNWR